MADAQMFGAYIRQQREALGLTAGALARAAQVAPATISRIESGRRGTSSRLAKSLADALNLPPAEVLERAGHTDDAVHWREQDAKPVDPLVTVKRALGALPMRPAARGALVKLAEEVVRAHALEGAAGLVSEETVTTCARSAAEDSVDAIAAHKGTLTSDELRHIIVGDFVRYFTEDFLKALKDARSHE